MVNLDPVPFRLPVLVLKNSARMVFWPGLKHGPRIASPSPGSVTAWPEQSTLHSTNYPFGYVSKDAFLR